MRLPVWGHHHWWIERFQRFGCYSCVGERPSRGGPAQAGESALQVAAGTNDGMGSRHAGDEAGWVRIPHGAPQGPRSDGAWADCFACRLGEPGECAWLAAGDVAPGVALLLLRRREPAFMLMVTENA